MASATINVPISIDLSTIQRWMESSDIVEVVRCKDCEYWRQDYGLWENVPYCELTATRTDPDFFCAGGERKGE